MKFELAPAYEVRLLKLLRDFALLHGNFALASGEVTSTYLDVRRLSLNSEGAEFLGARIVDFVTHHHPILDGYGGMSIGADPLVTAACMTHRRRGLGDVDGVLVRKHPKPHGSHEWLLGGSRLGEMSTVLILEDVVTSGSSSLNAAKRIRDEGFNVKACLCVVDREAGAEEALAEEGILLYSMTTLKQVLGE